MTKKVRTSWALLALLCALLLVTPLVTGCDSIAGDAGTYAEPTPPSGVWQVESDQHARRESLR